MRNDRFSSPADRRWQRRYERIQQRKEEARYRKEAEQSDEQLIQQVHYINDRIRRFDSREQIIASVPTYRITVPEPEFDRPNLNATSISSESWHDALESYFGVVGHRSRNATIEKAVTSAYDELYHQIEKAWEDYIQEHSAEWFDSFVDVKNIGIGDPDTVSIEFLINEELHDSELDMGDTGILDSFLGEFVSGLQSAI